MYLRYRAKYYNEETQQIEFGFFAAAEYLKNYGALEVDHRKELEDAIHYFDNQLPIPDYYQKKKNRQSAKSATSWFKETAVHFIKRMNELSKILETYHIEIERISNKKVLGKKIFEDEYQITVLPYREVGKQFK